MEQQENDQMTQTFNFEILKFHFKIATFSGSLFNQLCKTLCQKYCIQRHSV